MSDSRTIRTAKLCAKLAIAVFLLVGLYRLGSIDHTLILEIFGRPVILVVSIGCLLTGLLLGGLRWWILLDMSGHNFGLSKTLRLQLVGGFFSTYLPGAAGGDLIRGAYILKIIPKNEGRTAAVLSIAIDRLFALLGLIFVGAAASGYIFLNHAHSSNLGPYTGAILAMVIVSPLAVIGIITATIVLPSLGLFHLLPPRIQTYLQIFRALSFQYLKRWQSLLACSAISILASAIVIVGIISISTVFSFAPNPMVTAVAGVFGNVFSAIPITPGGVGVGESAFLAACRELTGSYAPFASIYLTFRLLMLLANIPGGIIAVIDRISREHSTSTAKPLEGDPV